MIFFNDSKLLIQRFHLHTAVKPWKWLEKDFRGGLRQIWFRTAKSRWLFMETSLLRQYLIFYGQTTLSTLLGDSPLWHETVPIPSRTCLQGDLPQNVTIMRICYKLTYLLTRSILTDGFSDCPVGRFRKRILDESND